MIKKTTQKPQDPESKTQSEDYYQEIIATRGAPEAAHLLAADCRKRDTEIKMLKTLLGECKTAIDTAIMSEDGLDGAEGEGLLVKIDSVLQG